MQQSLGRSMLDLADDSQINAIRYPFPRVVLQARRPAARMASPQQQAPNPCLLALSCLSSRQQKHLQLASGAKRRQQGPLQMGLAAAVAAVTAGAVLDHMKAASSAFRRCLAAELAVM